MKIAVGSDHRGYYHKKRILQELSAWGYEGIDCGCAGTDPADYPDAALLAAGYVADGTAGAGILICGSGIGMSIAANKVRGVRASLCFTEQQARTTRQHNDSNVLCLSGDAVDEDTSVALAKAWLGAEFEAGRHARRVDKITAYEAANMKQE